MKSPVLLWILRIIPALIMLQTLFFKFSASAESVYIFTTLGIEPWGRILSGLMELIAGILLLIPGKTLYGAILGAGVMAGAIMSHLKILGIEVMGDGGQLFIYALITFVCCALLVYINRVQLFSLLKKQS
ncbi:MAG: DoxX family protein [Bacteroidetes bacterium]|nr:DoxX family protein [Bacteroidota bacterium]MBL0074274.1 DoxX family protein [Bacteroidota bacterium]